jgi:hypothetical protein
MMNPVSPPTSDQFILTDVGDVGVAARFALADGAAVVPSSREGTLEDAGSSPEDD